jgi:hypothetical protein
VHTVREQRRWRVNDADRIYQTLDAAETEEGALDWVREHCGEPTVDRVRAVLTTGGSVVQALTLALCEADRDIRVLLSRAEYTALEERMGLQEDM